MNAKKKNTKPAETQYKNISPSLEIPSGLNTPWRFVGLITLLLVIFLGFYFRSFIFTPGGMISGSDMNTQAFQTRLLGVEYAKEHGSYPLWNQYSYCGIPYLGALAGPMFFPTSALYFMMPLERAIGWSIFLMMVAGGLFAYFWIRELGLSRTAGAFCSVSWAFTGLSASTLHGGHDGRAFTLLMMPLVFFFLERAINRRKLVYFLLMGLAVALQIFSPHTQMMYYSSLAVSAYFLYRLISLKNSGESWSGLIKLAAGFTVGFVIAVGIAAIQFWPVYVNKGLSHRQSGTGLGFEGWDHATQFSMHPIELLTLIIPGFMGELSGGAYWGPENFKLHSEYLGMLPLIFAIGALIWRRNSKVWFFVGLTLFAFFFSFGGYTPFFKLPYYLLPMVKDFRAPNMMFFVAGFSLLTIAGYGLDYIISGRRENSKSGDNIEESSSRGLKLILISVLVFVAMLLVFSAGKAIVPKVLINFLPKEAAGKIQYLNYVWPSIIRATAISALIAAIVLGAVFLWRKGKLPIVALLVVLFAVSFIDLDRVNSHWLKVQNPAEIYPGGTLVDKLKSEPEPFRVFFYPSPDFRWQDYWDNSLLYWRIPAINASMPLRLEWYEELMGTHMFRNFAFNFFAEKDKIPERNKFHRIWNTLNAEYIIIREKDTAGQVNIAEVFNKVFPSLKPILNDQRNGKILYENPEAWDRVKLFGAFEVEPDGKAYLEKIADSSFDYGNVLVLMEEPQFDGPAPTEGTPQGNAEFTRVSDHEIKINVETDRPSLVYVAETWHPFWEATVDGKDARIYRADLAMRAVYVNAGNHEIRMTYESPPIRNGRWVTLISLLILAAAVGWSSVKRDW